ncbi:EamA family transporter [bacterium]|nr:EamA family transporter [bacterium]
MKQLFSDWRVLSAIAILGWGAWGILSKIALRHVDWRVMLLISSIAVLPLVVFLGLPAFDWKFNRYVLFAALAGLGASLATLAFNRALQKGGPANVVVPLTSQYVLVIVLFSTIFLKEPITWQRIVGIAAAIVAIVMLSL